MVALAFWRRARGAVWRAVFLALLLLFLANPILRREERAPLDDLVLMLSDRSPSQGLADRPAQLAEAEAALRERIERMPGVELRELTLDGESRQGSRLFTRLQEGLAESDRARLGAVVALTDGQAHDAPADPADPRPAGPAARAAHRPARRERPPARHPEGAQLRRGRRAAGDRAARRRRSRPARAGTRRAGHRPSGRQDRARAHRRRRRSRPRSRSPWTRPATR